MEKELMEFRELAYQRWESLENGDSKTANLCFEKLLKISKRLRNKEKLMELSVLLDDPHDGVKFETASKLLTINLNKAEEILGDLSTKKGIIPFAAKQTLKQWKAGKLKF